MKKYITELIGSFFLVLALGLTGNAMASGFLFVAIIYFGEQISGAHYNPAVTLAFWAAGAMRGKTVWVYIANQSAGALVGCLFVFYLAGTAFQIEPSAAATPFQYSSLELLFGFLLCMVYLVMSLIRHFRGTHVFGLVVGVSYTGLLMVGEPVTGGVFNPAVAAAASAVDFIDDGESYRYLVTYLLAPATGGLAAGNLYRYLWSPES